MKITCKNNKITTDSNESIHIHNMYQEQTYKDLLCGIPDKNINDRIIKDALVSAKEFIIVAEYSDEEYLELIPPDITETEYIPSQKKKGAYLPQTMCMANISYSKGGTYEDEETKEVFLELPDNAEVGRRFIFNSDDYVHINICFVWFQQNYCMPIDNKVIQNILSICRKHTH